MPADIGDLNNLVKLSLSMSSDSESHVASVTPVAQDSNSAVSDVFIFFLF
jgi:hypothetical protein